MAQREMNIDGHRVLGDEEARRGMEYLNFELSVDEAKVFFKMAKAHGQAEFQDSHRNNYTLVAGQNMTYTVVARKPESQGWF